MTTSFDDYMRELEARATDDERALLDAARKSVESILDSTSRRIKRRENVDKFVGIACAHYGISNVVMHPWPNDPLDHDGPCVEIRPRNTGSVYFTVLPLKDEVWAHDGADTITEAPITFRDADEVFEYIDSLIC